jgi:ribose transport system permease protein
MSETTAGLGEADVTTGETISPAGPPTRTLIRLQLGRFSGLYVWAAFVLVYALWIPHTFLTVTTLQSVASNEAIAGIVALGVVVAMAAGAFDLSFAATLSMSSVIIGSMMVQGHLSPVPAIVLTLLAGAVVGVVNGLLVTGVGISPIAATLGTSSLIQAVIDRVTDDGQFISGFPKSFTDLATPKPFGIPILTVYLLVLALAVWYFLEHSPVGRRLQATGSGPDAARLAGVNTGRMVFLGLMASSTMATVAGILVTAQLGSVTPTIGGGYLISVFAAVLLGTTQLKVGRFNVWGTMLAIYLLATGVKGLQLVGGQGWVTDAFNGAALLIAVSLAVLGQRRRGGGRLMSAIRLRKRPQPAS